MAVITNPDFIYLLLMIGLAGVYFEFSNPGAIVPGLVGGAALVIALYSLQSLPVDYTGFLVILLGLLFFILDVKIASHGGLGLAGTACVVVGSFLLFRNPAERVRLSVILPISAAASWFFLSVAHLAARAQALPPKTGKDALVGMIGKATRTIDPEGKVFVNGELWNAQSEERIEEGERVEVTAVHNLKLKVKRIDGN